MAKMFLFPPPTPSITPLGVFLHVSQISNFVTNSGTWTPSDVTLLTPLLPQSFDFEVYNKLDWSRIPLQREDPEVQEIINPDINKIDEKIAEANARTDLQKTGVTQLNNIKSEIINEALSDQGLLDDTKEVKSGYKTLDELLKIAGDVAPKLKKDPKVKYSNLKLGYVKGIHGLCPQGTQAIVSALTGSKKLGMIYGHADWFSFKEKTTGGGRSSFSIDTEAGVPYYNEKVKINQQWTKDSTKWQVGDIIAQGYKTRSYGHIQVWTGFSWNSDFTQGVNVQQNYTDFDTLALWRLNDAGIAAVESQKSGQ